MDFSAIAQCKCFNVPACYNWLSLDRRGDWRLQGERVTHSGLIQFINRQYGSDESGCWFLQNGSQRVFVALAYTPWIFSFSANGVQSHTGQPVSPMACYLDNEGNALIATKIGIGLLDDRDLPAFLDQCRQHKNATVNEEIWLKIMAGETLGNITWHGLPLAPIHQNDVARRFNFQPHPQP